MTGAESHVLSSTPGIFSYFFQAGFGLACGLVIVIIPALKLFNLKIRR